MRQKWKFYILPSILFCFWNNANAQFKEIGAFGNYDTISPIIINDSLYGVISKRIYHDYDPIIKIVKWNSTGWQTLATLETKMYNRVSAVNYYNNEIYIIGQFDSIPTLGNKISFLKWNWKTWSALGNLPHKFYTHYYGNKTMIFENQLWIARNFSWDRTFMFLWDGNILSKRDSTYKEVIEASVSSLDTLNNKIYALGNFRFKEGSDTIKKNILVWNGFFWEPTNNPENLFYEKYLEGRVGYRKQWSKYGYYRTDTLSYWVGKKEYPLTKGFNDQNKSGWTPMFVSFKDKIYRFGYYDFNGKNRYIFLWDGFKWIAFDDLRNLRGVSEMNSISTSNETYIFSSTNMRDSMFVFKLTDFGIISGTVFHDKNLDCKQNVNETGSKNSYVMFMPGSHYVNTDDNGNYNFIADTGIYNAISIPKRYWEQTCPSLSTSIQVKANINDEVSGINFGINPIPNIKDMRVTLTASTGWRVRQGFAENYKLCYENLGTVTSTGKIYLKVDNSVFNNFYAYPNPTSYTNGIAEWNVDSFKMDDKACIFFNLTSTVNNRDSVKIIAWFEGENWNDSTVYDNYDTLKQLVVGSYDPNDKQCNPSGDITKTTKEIRYHIRFQNTGTDTAYRVIVIDTMDVNLPLTKVMMNSASHNYKLDIRNNVFKWTFENIMLPDSNINEPLSHGYISYTAQIKPGLATGTEIKNTAHIYFDYQKPVVTNQTRNKIAEPVGIKKEKKESISETLHIYPNPASDYVVIKNEGKIKREIQLINMVGQVVAIISIDQNEITKIDVQHLHKGMYFIRANGDQATKIIID